MSTSTDQPRDVVFVDVETSGKDPRRHRAWEVAAWNITTGHRCEFFVHIPDMSKFLGGADPIALRIGKFLDRYPFDETAPSAQDTNVAIADFRDVLFGRRPMSRVDIDLWPAPVILGSNPGFDIAFLKALYLDTRQPDPETAKDWHYHPIDLGSYAAGVLGVELGTQSLSAATVAEMCGLEPGGHSAGGDVTSGGRAYLLLREAARAAARGDASTPSEWLAQYRSHPCAHMIEREFGTIPEVVSTTS